MQQDEAGLGGTLGPLDWRRILPFEPHASSERLGRRSVRPAIREAGVVGVPDSTCGEIVHAYFARKDGHVVTEAALKRFLEVRIAAYKVPEAIRFLSDLPKGPTGKVARQTLRQWSAGAAPVQGPASKITTEATFTGSRPARGDQVVRPRDPVKQE